MSHPGQFKPGQSGNPNGMPPIDPEIKEARKFTKARYEGVIHRVMAMSIEEIKAFIATGEGDVLETIIATCLMKSMAKGDVKTLEKFTDRVIGPVTKKLSVNAGSIAELMVKFQQEGSLESEEDPSGPQD